MKIPIFEHPPVQPFARIGLTGRFWDVDIDTVLFTWIAMAFLFLVVFFSRLYTKRNKTNPFTFAVESVIDFFIGLCKDSFGSFKYGYFSFILSLFSFVLFCNLAGLIPFMKEPTENLNTAFACGISSFCYVQFQKIKNVGFWEYLKEYFSPFFLLFPLNVIGELAKVASMSFRLFGNILGGSIIIIIAKQALEPFRIHFMIFVAISLPLMWIISKYTNLENKFPIEQIISVNNILIFLLGWLLIFFGLFEGIVQAFVITMLTVTYLSMSHGLDESRRITC